MSDVLFNSFPLYFWRQDLWFNPELTRLSSLTSQLVLGIDPGSAPEP